MYVDLDISLADNSQQIVFRSADYLERGLDRIPRLLLLPRQPSVSRVRENVISGMRFVVESIVETAFPCLAKPIDRLSQLAVVDVEQAVFRHGADFVRHGDRILREVMGSAFHMPIDSGKVDPFQKPAQAADVAFPLYLLGGLVFQLEGPFGILACDQFQGFDQKFYEVASRGMLGSVWDRRPHGSVAIEIERKVRQSSGRNAQNEYHPVPANRRNRIAELEHDVRNSASSDLRDPR